MPASNYHIISEHRFLPYDVSRLLYKIISHAEFKEMPLMEKLVDVAHLGAFGKLL